MCGRSLDKTFDHHLIIIVSRAACSGPPHLDVFVGITKGLIFGEFPLSIFALWECSISRRSHILTLAPSSSYHARTSITAAFSSLLRH